MEGRGVITRTTTLLDGLEARLFAAKEGEDDRPSRTLVLDERPSLTSLRRVLHERESATLDLFMRYSLGRPIGRPKENSLD